MIYGYTRVSTDDQEESLLVQQHALAAYAAANGWRVERVFIDRITGSMPLYERPSGREMLLLAKPGDIIICTKLDRMFRSALDALEMLSEFKDHKIVLHMIDLGGDVSGNGVAKFMFTMLSAVAEMERDRIRERIADVKQDQKRRGRYLGGIVPYGYRVNERGILVPDRAKQNLLAQARALREQGQSLGTIKKTLQLDVARTSLHRILRRADGAKDEDRSSQ